MELQRAFKNKNGLSDFEDISVERAIYLLETYYRNPMELLSQLERGELKQITTPFSVYKLKESKP